MREKAGEVICRICGHEAKHHDATVNDQHGSYVIKGCCVIDIKRTPYPPWTMESIEAGQHKPCRCRWDGKTKQEQ